MRRFWYSLGLLSVVALTVLGSMAVKFGRAGPAAIVETPFLPSPSAGQLNGLYRSSVPERANPTYKNAPVPGSIDFRAFSFDELDAAASGTPGTIAARRLLVRSHDGNVATAEAVYDGTVKDGFDEYQRAVFLNTVADIQKRDERLLDRAVFLHFYRGENNRGLEYGIVLSGVTEAGLNNAQMGLAGFMGLMGRRSPKTEAIASLEATPVIGSPDTFAFDVDLYNPKADVDKHSAEADFNLKNRSATHPADVARALRHRGVLSGVLTG